MGGAAFDVKPLAGGIGAEVIGLDLDREIDAATGWRNGLKRNRAQER